METLFLGHLQDQKDLKDQKISPYAAQIAADTELKHLSKV